MAALDALARLGHDLRARKDWANNAGSAWAVDLLPRQPDGSPTWPGGVIGSITHTAWASLAAVAPRRLGSGLGIDSQAYVDPQAGAELLSVCADPAERDLLMAQPDPTRAVAALFSAKEAFYKALHSADPRALEFDAVTLVAWTAGDGRGAPDGLVLQPAAFLDLPACHAWLVADDHAVHTTVLLGASD